MGRVHGSCTRPCTRTHVHMAVYEPSTAVYTAVFGHANSPYTAVQQPCMRECSTRVHVHTCTRPSTGRVHGCLHGPYTAVYTARLHEHVHGCVRSVHTARVHDPCVRRPVYTTAYGPCTCVHAPCTWPRNGHVHGRLHEHVRVDVYMCTRTRIYVFTAVNGPSTRPCTCRVHDEQCTRPRTQSLYTNMYTAVYRPCTRSVSTSTGRALGRFRSCTWRVHGSVTVHMAGVHVYTCTLPLRGRVRAVHTARIHTRIHGPCRRPCDGRFRPCTWHLHGRVHVYTCTRPCTWP